MNLNVITSLDKRIHCKKWSVPVTLQGAFPREGGIYAPAMFPQHCTKGYNVTLWDCVWKTSLAELYLTPSASLL